MFENIDLLNQISFVLVFLEGVFSFFSPCVLPLIPIYMTYLAGNTIKKMPDGSIIYDKKKTFLHTLCFAMGVSSTFFLLGISFSAIGRFFSQYQIFLTKIGGIIIIFLGLFQLEVFNFKFLQKHRSIDFNIGKKEINPLIAFVMGFTFSFAWTPCVGPALSSVLILASSAKNGAISNILILLYSIGFILPFLILGLFTSKVLNFFKNNAKIVKYTIKISGVLLVILGIMTFTGFMNGISSYLNTLTNNKIENNTNIENNKNIEDNKNTENIENNQETETEKNNIKELPDAFDFTLKDQYGNEHTLSEYKDKVVFLNFWATWCNPCLIEMPHIEDLYAEYGLNKEDVIILGVANPKSKEYPNNSDVEKEEIINFLDENGYTFPVVFDETGEVSREYFIRAFPTTFMINKDGKIYGYVASTLTKDIMKSIIEETLKN